MKFVNKTKIYRLNDLMKDFLLKLVVGHSVWMVLFLLCLLFVVSFGNSSYIVDLRLLALKFLIFLRLIFDVSMKTLNSDIYFFKVEVFYFVFGGLCLGCFGLPFILSKTTGKRRGCVSMFFLFKVSFCVKRNFVGNQQPLMSLRPSSDSYLGFDNLVILFEHR